MCGYSLSRKKQLECLCKTRLNKSWTWYKIGSHLMNSHSLISSFMSFCAGYLCCHQPTAKTHDCAFWRDCKCNLLYLHMCSVWFCTVLCVTCVCVSRGQQMEFFHGNIFTFDSLDRPGKNSFDCGWNFFASVLPKCQTVPTDARELVVSNRLYAYLKDPLTTNSRWNKVYLYFLFLLNLSGGKRTNYRN